MMQPLADDGIVGRVTPLVSQVQESTSSSSSCSCWCCADFGIINRILHDLGYACGAWHSYFLYSASRTVVGARGRSPGLLLVASEAIDAAAPWAEPLCVLGGRGVRARAGLSRPWRGVLGAGGTALDVSIVVVDYP